MEIVYLTWIAALLSDCQSTDELAVSIRHAKKHSNREQRYEARSFALEASLDYEWSSTTDATETTDWSAASSEPTTELRDQWPAEGASDEPFLVYGTEGLAEELGSAKEDVVTKFLRIVESQQELGANCTAGTDLNLGEGVVDRYAQERFRVEAEVAVNRANMMTRLWKYGGRKVMDSEYLLHANVFSMVEFNENIFAAGNCYDKLQYKDYQLYCSYAYRLPEGRLLAKNLAVEYNYLGNSSEWFFQARKNAEKVIKRKRSFRYGYYTYTLNETHHSERKTDEILSVTYEDGRWSKPYYDCGGGNIWMLTYTVPFFGYKNDTYYFKGTSGIDIDLRRVDIDQCPLPEGETSLNIFAASDKCKKATTYCVSIKGLGFRRGSYKCVCQKGFYFKDPISNQSYFDGSVIEEEYEKLMMGETSIYNETNSFECLPCSEGCDTCNNAKPCVVSLNWLWRSIVLSLTCIVIILLFGMEFMTWKYRNLKIIRAASPLLLRVIAFGAFLIYCTTIVMYPVPTIVTCTMKNWLRELGFSITYGALMLKTWRIAVIFQVRSAKAVKITDMDLLKKLGIIVLVFSTFLTIRTLVAPPSIKVGITADNLKAYLCETNWWDRWFSFMEAIFLAWGVRLCLSVRKAPSQFNESRYISFTIYNEFCMSTIFSLLMVYFQIPANPDIEYVISFAHTQITITVLLCFIFGSKAYLILTGGGREVASSHIGNAKTPSNKFLSKPMLPASSQTFPSSTSINVSACGDRLVIQDVQDELHTIFRQIEGLREKNARNGSRELTVRLNRIHDCLSKSLSEVSVEDESSSSNMLQERPAEERLQGRACNNVKLVAIRSIEDEPSSDQNTSTGASIDAKNNNGRRATPNCRSWFRRYFAGGAIFGGRDTVKYSSTKNEVDIKVEPARVHAIILNDEQLSQCKQVSL